MRMPEGVRMFVMKIFWKSFGPGHRAARFAVPRREYAPGSPWIPPYRAADGSMYWLSNCLPQIGRL